MKRLVLIIVILIVGSKLLTAQDESTAGELNFRIINNTSSATVLIQMELISSLCWNDEHDITYLYSGGSLSTTNNNTWLEFLACWETTLADSDRTFGLGYYKFTGKVNGIVKDYFYIDYRTSDLPENFGAGDINLSFDISNGNFYYYGTQNLFPTNTSIWEEKVWIEHITVELEPLPPDNLNLTSSGSHPYLTWSHSTNTGDYWTGYAIYRSVVSGCGSAAGTFIKIDTPSKYTTSYTDDDFTVNGAMTAHYKITAVNGERESVFTATLNICVGLYKDVENKTVYEYNLDQNYPNPFNPSTKISFSLKENTFVSLRVFDILGREVIVLINGTLNAGNHQVQFNGSGLESGVYFYEIKTDNFRNVKKLILTK